METKTINNEECRLIDGFERYHISEFGRIYRTETGRPRSWRTKGKAYINEVKLHFRLHNGKLRQGFASLTDVEGKLHNIAVATLVAIAFDIMPEDFNKKKSMISFKDGNKQNLHYSNLVINKKTYVSSKLTALDVREIKKHIKNGIPLKRIGEMFAVSEMQISRIKTGENWGNGKRKILAPVAPFKIKDGKMRRYIATFESQKVASGIKKRFTIKRNPDVPTDNLIVGIVNGYKLSSKHSNITRAEMFVKKLNIYFFGKKADQKNNSVVNTEFV